MDHSKQQNPESWGKWAFKHVAGVGIGSAIGAGGLAVASVLDLPRGTKKVFGGPKGGAFWGAIIAGFSTIGSGHAIYNATVGQFEHKPSFADKIVQERATRQKDNTVGLAS